MLRVLSGLPRHSSVTVTWPAAAPRACVRRCSRVSRQSQQALRPPQVPNCRGRPSRPAPPRRSYSANNTATLTRTSGGRKHVGVKLVAAAVVLVGAGAGLEIWHAYRELEEEEAAELSDPSVAIEPPPAEFVHPFSEKPMWWRVLFTIKRTIYLAWVFLPVAGLGVISQVVFPNSERWRQAFLDALLRAVERAGCSFMKLAQWISMRPDMFPRDLVNLFARLRDGVPPHSYKQTRKVIKESLGKEIEGIFEWFAEKPVASGTVAQIHRAELKPEYAINGEIVDAAVKVRHPHVLEETYVDLDIIFKFVDTFLPRSFSLPCSQDELAHILQQQLDLRWEAYNLYMFNHNFRAERKSGLINFPQVSKQLTTDSVLVESWVEGSTIAKVFSHITADANNSWTTDINQVVDQFTEAIQERKKELARILFDMNVKMFLRDNYVHGDMHAGNLIFSQENGQVTVIDAGLITQLKPDIANAFGDFLRAICDLNVDKIVGKLLEFNVSKPTRGTFPYMNGKQDPIDEEAFRQRIRQITEKWAQKERETGQKYALGDVVGEILLTLQQFGIVLRGDIAASIMSISVSEGLIMQLDPDFDMVKAALPFFVRYRGWSAAKAAIGLGGDRSKTSAA